MIYDGGYVLSTLALLTRQVKTAERGCPRPPVDSNGAGDHVWPGPFSIMASTNGLLF